MYNYPNIYISHLGNNQLKKEYYREMSLFPICGRIPPKISSLQQKQFDNYLDFPFFLS